MIRWFGVRHHSPAAARLVRELVLRERPDAVLIEGPWDFNDRIGELALEHRLPIAIYSSVVLEAGRAGAYHPFCVHSPEWQALRAGFEIGADVRFIDLPWASIAGSREVAHRYGDHELRRSRAIPALCERLGVDDFDAAWDVLAEIDPALGLDEYLRRVEPLCAELRDHVSEVDARRERFMAQQIRETSGDVLVVCGGFHVEGLRELVAAPADAETPTASEVVALTPYSFEALDALTGYEAGMPNPGFYDLAWRDADPARAALQLVVGELRRRGQHVSPADLIGVESTARGLALMRGHARVWRGDLLDGILGALVKDELELGVPHPMLDAAHAVLRGGARGKLADGVSRPPFVRDLEAALERFELVPAPAARTVEPAAGGGARTLAAAAPDRRAGPAWLRAARPARRAASAGACASTVASTGRRWRLPATGRRSVRRPRRGCWSGSRAWSGTRGPPPPCSPTRRCAAWSRSPGRCSPACGSWSERRRTWVRWSRRCGRSCTCTATRPCWAPRATRRTGNCSRRSMTACCGCSAAGRRRTRASRRCARWWRRSSAAAATARSSPACWSGCGTTRTPRPGCAVPRSAPCGCSTPRATTSSSPGRCSSPTRSCSATSCSGCSRLAREPVQRRPDLVERIDEVVMAFADAEFLDALPALRRAFSAFTPREKDRLARGLPGGARLDQAAAADPLTLAAMLELEGRLRGALERYGVRT